MTQSVLISVFAWPILMLTIHLLLAQNKVQWRNWVQAFGVILWLIISILLFVETPKTVTVMMANWPAPFGIALVADKLATLMLVVFAITATCINFYSYYDHGIIKKQQAFYCGYWLLLLGAAGAILTADIFNLYVWFEVMLVSAFILLACSRQPKPGAMMHYAIMNITGTLLVLLAVAMIYSAFGSLNYAAIALQLQQKTTQWLLPILCMMLFAIGLKGAVFPLYFWLPKAYPKPSASATMMLSSLITKVVMVVLLRLAWLWPPIHQVFLTHSLLVIALATMFFGVLGAASQFRFKDILSFHIVSQLGYILVAIVLPLPIAIIAAVYFIIHNVFVKTNLFMVSGVIQQQVGSDDFKKLGGVLSQNKWLSWMFFISAMSLAGFPPLSGFWGKFLVIKAALTAHFYLTTVIAIVVSLFTLYSMIKIWRYVFCQQGVTTDSNALRIAMTPALAVAMMPLLLCAIVMGIFPDVILAQLHVVASQLSHPGIYIHSLLGGVK